MNQDSHVKLFDLLIFSIELRRSGFIKNLKDVDNISHNYSTCYKRNYRLLEYLKNDEIDFERRRKRIS